MAEHHKRAEHDHHRRAAVARATQRARVDLVEADEHVARQNPPEKERAVCYDLLLAVEKSHKLRREDHHRDHDEHCRNDPDAKRRAQTHLGALHTVDAEVLPHERGGRKRDGLHRQQDELVNFGIRRPAGHAVRAEMVDVGLHKNIRERGDRHLDRRRDADADDLPDHFPADAKITQEQPDAGFAAHERDENEERGRALRDDRRKRHAAHAHVKRQHEHKVEHGVEHRGNDEEIERPSGIAHRAEDARTHVIQHQPKDARKINGEVCGGFRHDLGGRFHQVEHRGDHENARAGEDHAEHKRHDDGGMHRVMDLFRALCPIILRDHHACAA